MADELISQFEIEIIPDADYLFMRIHRNYLRDGELTPGAFKNQPNDESGMSVDWSLYSTPGETRNRARTPVDNGVIKFTAGGAREIPNQSVVHEPINSPEIPNQAHSEVFGEKDVEVRERFMQVFEWEIAI